MIAMTQHKAAQVNAVPTSDAPMRDDQVTVGEVCFGCDAAFVL